MQSFETQHCYAYLTVESSPIWLGPRTPLLRGLDSIDRNDPSKMLSADGVFDRIAMAPMFHNFLYMTLNLYRMFSVGAILPSPMVDHGTIYFVSTDGSFYAVHCAFEGSTTRKQSAAGSSMTSQSLTVGAKLFAAATTQTSQSVSPENQPMKQHHGHYSWKDCRLRRHCHVSKNEEKKQQDSAAGGWASGYGHPASYQKPSRNAQALT
jgi:hypothetical protein